MLIVISPAKSLDFESPLVTTEFSQPALLEHSQALIDQLKLLSPTDIESLMKISPKLALLNMQRFSDWQQPFTQDNARQALLAFTGDVYQGMAATNFSAADFNFAQQHLRILSGLYGLLKPLDLIQPYRLEMGTSFANTRGKNLYEFWDEIITLAVNDALAQQGDDILINLASNEYFSAIQAKKLKARIITPIFKDQKSGQYKIISFYAKKARGLMSAYIIQNQLNKPEQLKDFDTDGYYFSAEQSKGDNWVFLRNEI